MGRRPTLAVVLGLAVLVALLGWACACSGGHDGDAGDGGSGGAAGDAKPTEPALREELLAMLDADQEGRTGEATGSPGSDEERAGRLAEIIEEHGWPTFAMVGRDGATAAWAIAQHADFDVAFQEEALGLMAEAVEHGQADASELAYLEDRVAVNRGQPQIYGTQVRCVEGGGVMPATPITDEEKVDERRAAVGLDSLSAYLAEFEEGCLVEAATSTGPSTGP